MYKLVGHIDDAQALADLAGKCSPARNEHGLATTDRTLTAEVYGVAIEAALIQLRQAGRWRMRHCSLAILWPNGVTHLHSDDAQARYRLMFVLQTNPDAWVLHDGAWQQLEAGGVYLVDGTLPHAAVNYGNTLRIHLAVDLREETTACSTS